MIIKYKYYVVVSDFNIFQWITLFQAIDASIADYLTQRTSPLKQEKPRTNQISTLYTLK